MKALHMVACILLWVGGLNWGLAGLLNMNIVESVAGMDIAKIVYILVGLSTVYIVATHMSDCKVCSSK